MLAEKAPLSSGTTFPILPAMALSTLMTNGKAFVSGGKANRAQIQLCGSRPLFL